MSILEVNELTKDYGSHKGIFDITFSMEEGDVFGYLGPNGAGKTTTIRCLMGFLNPNHGKCSIMGMDCRLEQEKIQKNIGYLPGEIAFFDEMTGDNFLDLMASMRDLKNMERRIQLVDRFQLDTKGKIRKMSKGMKQKLAIVSAFMHDPKVYILDEPTAGLDPLMQNVFVELILEEKKKGKTILMSSHNFEEVSRTCNKVGIIREGNLVAVEDIHSLLSVQKKNYFITFTTKEDAKAFLKLIPDSKMAGELVVETWITGDINGLIKTMGQFNVRDIQVNSRNLEEVFMHYYGGVSND